MTDRPFELSGRLKGAYLMRGLRIIAVALIGVLASCAQVPEESVTLSEDVGTVLEELRQKNAALIVRMFDDRKAQINQFIDETYAPFVVSTAMEKVKALDKLKLLVDEGKGAQALKLMQIMVNRSLAKIQAKRTELLQPIQRQEARVKAAFDNAFGIAIKGTETTTGLLRSVRRVHSAQEQILAELGLKDLRNTVHRDAALVSDKLGKLLASTRNLDAALDEATKEGSACAAGDVECKFKNIKAVLEGAVDVGSAAKGAFDDTVKDGR